MLVSDDPSVTVLTIGAATGMSSSMVMVSVPVAVSAEGSVASFDLVGQVDGGVVLVVARTVLTAVAA